MKKNFYAIGLLAISVILYGCSNSSTHGTEKDLEFQITINNSGGGTVRIDSPLALDTASETQQDTANTASTTPTTRLQLTEGGSTAAGEASTLQDVTSQLRQKLNSNNRTETKTNTETNTPTKEEVKDTDKEENIESQVDNGKEEISDSLDYNSSKSYTSYGVRNGGRQAWRIPEKGTAFNGPIKFVFANGDSFTVKDTSKNCRDREDTCDRDSKAEMYGFVYKPGIGPNGEGDSDTGTSHGGIYLHAPYNNTSKTVKLYYNK